MRTVGGHLCRAVVVMVAMVAVGRILKDLRTPSRGRAGEPAVIGDTWPPVPVKSPR
jgi:hypothetical protein